MSTIIGIRDAADMNGGFYSPAKAKAAVFSSRFPLFRRLRNMFAARKLRLITCVFTLSVVVLVSSRLSFLMGWVPPHPNPSIPRGGGYTVLINTWKRGSALKQSIAHYASCNGVAAIHVVWSDSDPPSESLKSQLEKMVFSKSRAAQKPNFRFGISQEEDLNNRFKPIEVLTNDAVFSVDDDAIVSCPTLDFAFNGLAIWAKCHGWVHSSHALA